jgi:carbonic anhydrase
LRRSDASHPGKAIAPSRRTGKFHSHLWSERMTMDRRLFILHALACACCMKSGEALGSGNTASGGSHWSYEGSGSPDRWGELQSDFKVCQLGLEQTPIDLRDGIKGDAASVDYHYQPLPLRIVNNGHTIQLNADPGNGCVIAGTRYELLQLHLHHPSEHLLAGKQFDLECHFVHRSGAGEFAVSGVFIRPGAENSAMKAFFDAMPDKQGPELRASGTIDVAAMLPKSGGYFRYMGSLTTPPCSEGLTWTVYKEPIEASAVQIQKFAALFRNNARPVQQRNRRFLIETL